MVDYRVIWEDGSTQEPEDIIFFRPRIRAGAVAFTLKAIFPLASFRCSVGTSDIAVIAENVSRPSPGGESIMHITLRCINALW